MSILGRAIDRRFMQPGRRAKVTQFEEFSPAAGTTVFLGDSITEGGLWHEWFPALPVVNRGIGGDTANGVLARLPNALQGPPERIFLLIGTNDLTLGRKVDEIASDVAAIVSAANNAGVDIVIQSVMPRAHSYRDRILCLNDRYQAIAAHAGVSYLDLWPILADEQGGLRSDYTTDRLHLKGNAYRVWANCLAEYLGV